MIIMNLLIKSRNISNRRRQTNKIYKQFITTDLLNFTSTAIFKNHITTKIEIVLSDQINCNLIVLKLYLLCTQYNYIVT